MGFRPVFFVVSQITTLPLHENPDRTMKSVVALTNLTRICHEQLEDKCSIEVIDIERSPRLAKENQIVAIPTVVKTFPLPMRRVIGDLSNTERVLAGLGLYPMNKNDARITRPLHERP
jgi:circadian clock protein KaiB